MTKPMLGFSAHLNIPACVHVCCASTKFGAATQTARTDNPSEIRRVIFDFNKMPSRWRKLDIGGQRLNSLAPITCACQDQKRLPPHCQGAGDVQCLPDAPGQFSTGGSDRMVPSRSRTGTRMARPPRLAAADNSARTHTAHRCEDSSRRGYGESRDRKNLALALQVASLLAPGRVTPALLGLRTKIPIPARSKPGLKLSSLTSVEPLFFLDAAHDVKLVERRHSVSRE